jgi:hypothetical protein
MSENQNEISGSKSHPDIEKRHEPRRGEETVGDLHHTERAFSLTCKCGHHGWRSPICIAFFIVHARHILEGTYEDTLEGLRTRGVEEEDIPMALFDMDAEDICAIKASSVADWLHCSVCNESGPQFTFEAENDVPSVELYRLYGGPWQF